MLLLRNDAIARRVKELAAYCNSLDIATYSVGNPSNTIPILRSVSRARVIIGGFNLDNERRAQALTSAVARASRVEFRYLQGSHTKLILSHGHPRCAIVGSANLGSGASQEVSVEISRPAAHVAKLQEIFEEMWIMSRPIKPLDLVEAKRILETSVFEVPGT